MSNHKSVKAKFEELRVFDSSTLTGGYDLFGSPLEFPARIVKFQNDSDEDVLISTDGIVDHDFLSQGDRCVFDLTANNNNTEGCFFPAGTQFYLNGTAGTGNIYLTVIYTRD